jgi:hypothetical protein
MPRKAAERRAKEDLREGKAPTTAAGEFVREEMKQVGRGKRSPRSPRQAVAIGLSEARRAGVLVAPKRGRAKSKARPAAGRSRKRAA